MSDNQDPIFANGFILKQRVNRPDFVLGNLSVKVDDAVSFLREHEKNGWVNLDLKISKNGNPYVELDTFVPQQSQNSQQSTPSNQNQTPTIIDEMADDDDDLPF